MKNFFLSYKFWMTILVLFIGIILWDDDIEKGIKKSYVKHRMKLDGVNFSEMDSGFEHAKMFADEVDMDDNQNNMVASNVRTLFYKKDVATWSGTLLSRRAMKNPFESKFWGDVRMFSTDKQKMRTEEIRYFFNRKELYTQKYVTIWKGNAVITGRGLRYNTQTKEAKLEQDVMIRIWNDPASSSADIASSTGKTATMTPVMNHDRLPVAPPPSQIILPLNERKKVINETEKLLNDIASYSSSAYHGKETKSTRAKLKNDKTK